MQNRLNLNWDLKTKKERNQFIKEYLSSIRFEPNSEELEMMAKYILWGISESGLNGRQEGLELETSHGTWDAEKIESLDALIESPTFSESVFRTKSDPVYRTPREVFSRAEARASAPSYILKDLESLWTQIDTTELLISYYDLAHNKRTTPIRESLLKKFTPAQLTSLREKSSSLSLYKYLNLKHLLVELRRQQYAMRDSYNAQIITAPTWQSTQSESFVWGEDIEVRPLGLKFQDSLSQSIFQEDRFPAPSDLPEPLQEKLTSLLWKKTSRNYFDFCNINHLAILNEDYNDMRDWLQRSDVESTLPQLLDTFDLYVNLAHLKPMQLDLLYYKRQHKTNDWIATTLNKQYKHNYTINYISTLYRQSILKEIAETAAFHREVTENLFFPENFKTCIDCGRILLKDSHNFIKKTKVKDGFDCRCKECAKILRDKRSKK